MNLKQKFSYYLIDTILLNINTMERGLMMVLHSVIIGVVLYLLMVFVFQQNPRIAENRSILIAAAILIYMILFGHGLPAKINKNL